ncbi:MAG: APC family permease, partial [Gammaproteobacteria bacterium]|nr:APC family permease [Gammaproteobacteria bacterium]
ALSYGLIAREVIESGGEYVYLARNVHPLAGFLAGWVSMLAGFSGAIAFAASAFEAYLMPSGRPAFVPENAVAIGLVAIAGVLHGFVPRWGVATQTLVVGLKLGALLGLVAVAVWLSSGTPVPVQPAAAEIPPLSIVPIAASLVWVFLSYSGFNAAVYVAEEAWQPARTIPRAMLWGTLIVTFIYLALNALFVYAAPASIVAGAPNVAFVVAEFLGGSWFAEAVRTVILLALVTSVFSMVMTGPRVYAKMAEDGLLPATFATGRGLARAVALQVALAIAIILLTGLRELLSYLGFTLSLSSAFAIASVFVTYRRNPGSKRPIWHWLVPSLYVVTVVGLALLAAQHHPAEFTAAILTIASGCLLYVVAKWHNGRR